MTWQDALQYSVCVSRHMTVEQIVKFDIDIELLNINSDTLQ